MAQSATEKRKPIPVALLRFQSLSPWDGPGCKGPRTAIKSRQLDKQSLHTIEFYPWLHSFRVTFQPRDGAAQSRMVPLSRVDDWEPVDAPG